VPPLEAYKKDGEQNTLKKKENKNEI